MNPLFLTPEQIQTISQNYEGPVYVYSESKLIEYANQMLSMPHAYGLSVRYAMKANSNQNILRLFSYKGIKIDASSEFEALRALSIGIPAHDIELCGQEMPQDLASFVNAGMEFLATSLHQLEEYGKLFPGTGIGIRVNP